MAASHTIGGIRARRADAAHRARPAIARFLEDAAVVEVMLNPDGRIWIDRLSEGLSDTGERCRPPMASASCAWSRIMSAPRSMPAPARLGRAARERGAVRGPAAAGRRRAGLRDPQARRRRVHARRLCRGRDHVGRQAEALREGVVAANILVAGGTSTGKTTLTNALLAEVAKTSDRVVIIEDTRELQCAAPNLVAMRTKDGVASLSDLVRSSLRLRPDRIPIGEVRGAEALDLLKAWGTGHPGGVGTIHAGSAIGALRRLEQLIQEAVVTVPRALIAETIDLVAVLSGRGSARRLPNSPASKGSARTATTASRPPSAPGHRGRRPPLSPSRRRPRDPTSAPRAPSRRHDPSVATLSVVMAAPPMPPARPCRGKRRCNKSFSRSKARSPRSSPSSSSSPPA
jgi:type IV secretion system protein VirB11